MNDAPLLGHGAVRVWYRLTEAIGEAETSQLIASLPASERERCLRHRFSRDQRDFAAAHALLRTALSRYGDATSLEWCFEVNAYGKPAIATAHGTDLTFNLSHTHGFVACAITRTAAIGIDVEPINRIAIGREIAAHYFSPTEIRALDTMSPELYQQRFIEVWTLKEAYIKAVGLGLSHALDTFSFVVASNDSIQFTPPPDVSADNWQFCLYRPVPGYRLALAVEHTTDNSAACAITLHEADRALLP